MSSHSEDESEDDDEYESSSRGSDQEEDEEEGEEGYRPGGYHRVAINDILGNWQVEKKLGWGHFSTVWLVRKGDQIAACKVQKSDERYMEAAKDEIEILRACQTAPDTIYSGKRFVVKLFDSFNHIGPNGTHKVMVFEVLGNNLLTLVQHYDYKGIPMNLVKQISWQICSGIDFLHRQAKVLHCDLKLENVLIAGMSFSLARQYRDDIPCVGTLKAQDESVNKGKAETIQARIIAMEASLLDMKNPDRKQSRKKIQKLKGQLAMIQDYVENSTLPPNDLNLFDTDNKNDESEWKVVRGSSRKNERIKELSDEHLASETFLFDLAQENWQRNFEFIPLDQPVRQSSGSSTEVVNQVCNMISSDSLSEKPVIVAGFIFHREDLKTKFGYESEMFTLSLLCGKVLVKEVGRDIDDSIIKDFIKCGIRKQFDPARTFRRIPKTSKKKRKSIWAVYSEVEVDRYQILEELENLLQITFLFNSRPIASFEASKTLGVETKLLLVYSDVLIRSFESRYSDIPARLPPKFIGSDLGITTKVDISVKIVDLGNACWVHNHFSDDIQTRQYRAPEVILNSGYDSAADIWSLACLVFELVTGELLFDPRTGKVNDKSYTRDEDHLARITELIGKIPKSALKGSRVKNFYNQSGDFHIIKKLHFQTLYELLVSFKVAIRDAEKVSSFLLPLLTWDPRKRSTAEDCLKHTFLSGLVG